MRVWERIGARILQHNPANIYLFKVNNRSTRQMCKICSKLTQKTPERPQCRRSGVFIVNFEQFQFFLVFLLLIWANKCYLGKISLLQRQNSMQLLDLLYILTKFTNKSNLPLTYIFLYPLKTSENFWFFRGYKKKPVAWNGLK